MQAAQVNLDNYLAVHERMKAKHLCHRELGQQSLISVGAKPGAGRSRGQTFESPVQKADFLRSQVHARQVKAGARGAYKGPQTGPVGAVAPGTGDPGPGPRAQSGSYNLTPEDCVIKGLNTIGDSTIAIGSNGTVTVGSGSCRCMTVKFIQMAGYRASDSDATNLIEDCSPCPVLLVNSTSGVYPNMLTTTVGSAWVFTDLDQAMMNCVAWHSFSSITDCQLTLTLRNILDDGALHVLAKMYVICEGGCCDY